MQKILISLWIYKKIQRIKKQIKIKRIKKKLKFWESKKQITQTQKTYQKSSTLTQILGKTET